MTVATTANRIVYNGNGATTAFSFPYRFFANGDLVVTVTTAAGVTSTKVLNTDYTVAGAGLSGGGTVSMTVAPASGEKLTIQRILAITQSVDYVDNDPLPASSLEDPIDRLTMIAQQLKDSLDRAAVLPAQLTGINATLPIPQAGQLLGWDATGTSIVNTSAAAVGAGNIGTTELADGAVTNAKVAVSAAIDAFKLAYLQAGTGAVSRDVQERLRDYASVFDYMTPAQIADVKSGAGAVNVTGAVQAALNANAYVYFPAGTYACGNLTWPSTLRSIRGASKVATKIKATGTLTAFTGFINLNGITGFELRDLSVEVALSYTSTWAIQILSSTKGLITNVEIPLGGSAGIRGSACNDVEVRSTNVLSYVDAGITFPNATGANNRVKIIGCYVPGSGTQTTHNIQIVGGGQHEVTGCVTTNNVPGSFGINYYLVNGGTISNNVCSNGVAEGINLQDCTNCTAEGNIVVSSASAIDFGMSMFGDPALSGTVTSCKFIGNIVVSAGKSGIALADRIQNCVVEDNIIINPNRLNEAQGSGILLYNNGCNSNLVQNNFCFDNAARMKYVVREFNDGGGNPAANFLFDNKYEANGLTAEWEVVSAVTLVSAIKPRTFSPTLTATTGAISAATVNSATFLPRGGVVYVQYDVTVTNNNTGAGAIDFSLPTNFTATTNGGSVMGRELVTNGWLIGGMASGAAVRVVNFNNAYPGATGSRYAISGWYRRA